MLPPHIGIAFIAVALATIPYGAPAADWYVLLMASTASALIVSLAVDYRTAFKTLSLWPLGAVVGAWACSIMACEYPLEVVQRAWGFAFYSLLFIAAQVTCWHTRTLKALVVTILLVLIALAVDLAWQHATTRSLIREVRAFDHHLMWGWYVLGGWHIREPIGSLGNRNDHAVAGILLPLCGAVMSTSWAWFIVTVGLVASGYNAVLVKSRQLMVGILVGLVTLVGLRTPPRIRWYAICAVCVLGAVGAFAVPTSRVRILESLSDPLSGRATPIVYGTDLFLGHPVLGIGPSLYGHYYVRGVQEGWTFNGQPLAATGMPWVHCLPIEIACEFGVIGLLAFGATCWTFVARLTRAIRMGGSARDLGVAVGASACSMAVMGLIDLTFIKDWVSICWWLVLGLGFTAPTLPGAQNRAKGATLRPLHGL